jgi:hypothetical protein
VLNKQLRVLVLRPMITVGLQNELRVRQVLLQDERIRRIDEHVVAAVHHECRLSDLLQVSIRDLSPERPISAVQLAVPERPFRLAKDRDSPCALSAAQDTSFPPPDSESME